ncbi:FAD binding domain-containing protein [Sabulicella rubraurantiaca]|uniref:FAD binding domain-containing protein n=1 Tax=Sabulicella rubraurantiaca TaxID=2811429 RepID=UPI001A974A43|nr:FAD binding domain-containing protein [Sabulicella rubraurantiaca]
MKAAPFTFHRAESLDHALDLLARHGGDCKPIAGGQSLVPMMAMRLARPSVLVDINRLDALKARHDAPDHVTLGAITRQRDMEADVALRRSVPLIAEALRWVGHVQTRNRGTIGGSLVHADPSAELPLAAAVLDATLVLRSQNGGERRVPASEFFVAPMFTAANEAECLTAVEWPVWAGAGVSCAFEEVAIRHGDFAMASAACQIQLDPDGTCRRATIGLGGVAGTPLAFPDLAQRLIGRRITATLAQEAAEEAAARSEPGTDMHADAGYRRHLAVVLLRRALLRAASAATPALAA